jgi:hypothetical protein
VQFVKKEATSCAMCIWHTISHVTDQPIIYLCMLQEIPARECICKGKSSVRPFVSDATVDCVRKCFQRSPQKSTGRMSCEMQLPQTAPKTFVSFYLRNRTYQLVQAVKPEHLAVRYEIWREIMARTENHDACPQGSFCTVTVRLSTQTVKRNGIRYVFDELKIIMTP